MSKIKYDGFSAGDILQILEPVKDYNTELPKGTLFTAGSFPPKVRITDKTDVTRKNCVRQYFVCGNTLSGENTVRVNLNKVKRISCDLIEFNGRKFPVRYVAMEGSTYGISVESLGKLVMNENMDDYTSEDAQAVDEQIFCYVPDDIISGTVAQIINYIRINIL